MGPLRTFNVIGTQMDDLYLKQTLTLLSCIFTRSKRHQWSRTLAVPVASSKTTAAPVVAVEVDTPTYLEVPDFQRVAILGDYASGVMTDSICQRDAHFEFH